LFYYSNLKSAVTHLGLPTFLKYSESTIVMQSLKSLKDLNAFLKNSSHHVIQGTTPALTQATILSLVHLKKNLILVVPNHKDISEWLHFFESHEAMLSALAVDIAILPHLSFWGSDRYLNLTQAKRQRLRALAYGTNLGRQKIILTNLAGLLQFTIDVPSFTQKMIPLEVGATIDQDELIAGLLDLGFYQSPMVEEEGQFSVRGSIIDLASPLYLDPIRIEFAADEITSLRLFDIETQKTKQSLPSIMITPSSERPLTDTNRKATGQRIYDHVLSLENLKQSDRDGLMDSFFTATSNHHFDILSPLMREAHAASLNYFHAKDWVFTFPTGVETCLTQYETLISDYFDSHQQDLASGRITISPERHFVGKVEARNFIKSYCLETLELNALQWFWPEESNSETFIDQRKFIEITSIQNSYNRFDQWIMTLQNLLRLEKAHIYIFAASEEQLGRLANLLQHRELPFAKSQWHEILARDSADDTEPKPAIHLLVGDLQGYLWLEDSKEVLIGDQLLLGNTQKRTSKSNRKLKNYLNSFRDLKVGDLVVHYYHGIGRYRGMSTMTLAGCTGDFLHIEFAGNDKIFLPADKLNLLQRYASSSEDGGVSLDKLGSGQWEKRKAKATEAIREMADKILKLQARRALSPIHIYQKPPDEYFQFEAEFPYTETEDQLKAIHDINQDFQLNKPVDRLVCGDVGFGKTEVALRAIYRAVLEGFQVLVLVPTTILCYQHYRNFTDRLKKHGVRVAQLNRFVPAKEAKVVLEDTASGKVDVLVGTHKILSNKLMVRRLGLIIVDEEQRFGVTHKERLKELQAGVDIITLTATPIPRTLHMAMLGLRDISIIATPPENRLSVKTYVAQFEESLIRDAIERELARQGQVFYVHNKVEDIVQVAAFVKGLCPKAQVRVAHGQMRENELETTILDFLEQKFEILVCTTIIESGVDMPSVNTLIIDQADHFGLAQLYQMRGRVGRSDVQAYAYFLTKTMSQLTEDARKRLEVIASHQDLGSGFQIASHDLEIRGAGNLIGADQSGHAAEVGLELYTDLLGEAIAELRNQPLPKARVDTEIKLPVTALIDRTYVADEGLRLQLYKGLFTADTQLEIDSLQRDTVDRFGALPEETLRLFQIARIKQILSTLNATQLSAYLDQGVYEIRFTQLAESQVDRVLKVVSERPTTYRLSPDYKLNVFWSVKSAGLPMSAAPANLLIETILSLLEPFSDPLHNLK
jgi:transcription-repair coupling factor (superfamily II helicase)